MNFQVEKNKTRSLVDNIEKQLMILTRLVDNKIKTINIYKQEGSNKH